jgi:hypothetical protein
LSFADDGKFPNKEIMENSLPGSYTLLKSKNEKLVILGLNGIGNLRNHSQEFPYVMEKNGFFQKIINVFKKNCSSSSKSLRFCPSFRFFAAFAR